MGWEVCLLVCETDFCWLENAAAVMCVASSLGVDEGSNGVDSLESDAIDDMALKEGWAGWGHLQ